MRSAPVRSAPSRCANRRFALVRSAPVRSAPEVRAGKVRAGKVRAGEVRASEVRAGEVGAGEVGAGEVRAFEVRAGEVRAEEVRAGEEGAGQVRASEVRATKVRAGEDRAVQIDPARPPAVVSGIPATDDSEGRLYVGARCPFWRIDAAGLGRWPLLAGVVADECSQDIHDGGMVGGRIVGDTLQRVDAADPHVDPTPCQSRAGRWLWCSGRSPDLVASGKSSAPCRSGRLRRTGQRRRPPGGLGPRPAPAGARRHSPGR